MRKRRTVLAITPLIVALGCAPPQSGELEANKELVRRFTEVSNAADWGALADLVTEDFSRHSAATSGPPITSRDAFIELQKGFLGSFPDQRVTLERLVAEGDFVAARATYSGTQTGPMGDLPATGKSVQSPFLAMFRIESGRIAELWVEWDNVGMLTQLGLFPPSPRGPTGG
jgi:steroid delta-isomerase-like uncharacterized protein